MVGRTQHWSLGSNWKWESLRYEDEVDIESHGLSLGDDKVDTESRDSPLSIV